MREIFSTLAAARRLTPQQLWAAGFRQCPSLPTSTGTFFVQKLPIGVTHVVLPALPDGPIEVFVGSWNTPLRYFCTPALSLAQLRRWLS
jgi:hypothetical protein